MTRPALSERRREAAAQMPVPANDEDSKGLDAWVSDGTIETVPDSHMNMVLWWERADVCLNNFHRLCNEGK